MMFGVFSLVIMNYAGTMSCTVIAVTTAISLIKARKETNVNSLDRERE